MALFRRIRVGQLTVIEDGRETVFGSGAPQATVHVHSPRAWPQLAARQPRHRQLLHGRPVGYARPHGGDPRRRAQRRGHRPSPPPPDVRARARSSARGPRSCATRRARSRKDIAAHYDLGNELFELMLDPTLMYSCAVFERRDTTLEEASIAKLELVCEKLDLGPRDHVVEIGTGWGGFAVYAASTRGCRVTTTTISREQHDVAARRVRAGGRRAPRRRAARRLPRPARHLRQARLAGDDRGGRLAGLRHVLRALLRAAGARTGRCCCRRSRWTTAPMRSRRRRRASSAPTCSRAAACPRSR